jgi:hypothetical protein
VDRLKLKCRSPRIAVRFIDGEAVFTHVPSAPGKPLNVGRALRVATCMWRYRVYRRLGFPDYDRAMPVPEIFQVRCLETDELFDVEACNRHTFAERTGSPALPLRRSRTQNPSPPRPIRTQCGHTMFRPKPDIA